MRGTVSSRLLLEPRSVLEALRLLADDPGLVPLAGCTDLYVSLNFGTLDKRRFLDLWGLDELRRIEKRGSILTIGALATYSELIRSAAVQRALPMLVAAAREVGGMQIQNRGTIGGNIANASPAADTLPVLAAADAIVVLRNIEGSRRVPITSFFTSYRQTDIRPGELIVSIEIPPVAGRQWFRKVGTRAAQAISKIVMAGVRSARPAIAVGSLAPTVLRLPKTEAILAAGGALEEAQGALLDEISPIDDLRSTAAYRGRVAANLLGRFWKDTS